MPYRPPAPGFTKTSPIIWPDELLTAIRTKAIKEDENISSLIRKVMAEYVGYTGPTRVINRVGS